jgi:hypothetical protein
MGPHALQPRAHVLELCELDLESRLGGSSPQREDVENQLGPVHDPNADPLLQSGALGRRKIFVEYDERRRTFSGEELELVGLSPSDIGGRVWRSETLNQRPGDFGSSRIDQLRQLFQMLVDEPLRLIEWGSTDEDRSLDGWTEFDRRARESVS